MQVGTVSSLNRYPVKSMLGEGLTSVRITQRGLEGDRAWALIDAEDNKVVSGKRPKRWLPVMGLTATTVADGVQVSFPDGHALRIGDPALDAELSELLGRTVSFASTPPENATYDEVWARDLKDGAAPYFDLPTREDDDVEMVDGGQFMSAQGTFFDYGALHLMTTSSTRKMEELTPGTTFEPRRFRPNIVVETEDDGFLETGWQGRTLSIGGVTLTATFTVPRCVLTTQQQGDLPADRTILKSISQHNSIDVFGTGTAYPCLGVYADVVTEGDIEPGMPVLLED